MQQQMFELDVKGAKVRGFYHFADNVDLANGEAHPVVIMANGYATEWQFGTDNFIQTFTDNGFITVNFDYRGFGASQNQLDQPRQIVDIPEQLEDFAAVINLVKAQPWLQQGQLQLWGSSLGGGHVLSMAAKTPDVAAVVAQVPHCDSREAFKTVKLSAVCKGMSSAFVDVCRQLFGASPLLLPVLAEPSSYGVMNHPGWLKHYQQLAKGSLTWENALPARSLLRGSDYRPIQTAGDIACPVLLVAGKTDAGVPFESVETMQENIKQARLLPYEGDHFEVYHGELQAGLIAEELAFMQANLG